MIHLVGCRLYDKSKRKVDKIAEVQRYVRAQMRKLGNLYAIFKQQNIPVNKCACFVIVLSRRLSSLI